MKSVLISIRPEWCEKIASGKKTIEVRKTAPKGVPFKCYIYETQGRTETPWVDEDGHFIYKGRGQVIGEFICDKVYNLVNAFGGIVFADENLNQLDPQLFRDMSCLTDEQTADYLGDKDGYGLHISDLKIYDKPKALSEFYKPCKEKYDCEVCKHGSIIIPPDEEEYALYHGGSYERYETVCHNVVNRPPQSWQYIDEVKE